MGVVRPYCGVLDKTENCPVAVSVSLVIRTMSVPGGLTYFLPESWPTGPERNQAASGAEDTSLSSVGGSRSRSSMSTLSGAGE